MNIVFLGTPAFATAPLQKLYDSGYNIVAVVSQPDRQKSRKGAVIKTPIRRLAEKLGLKTLAFERIKTQGDALRELKPDLFITAAYGQILSQEILDIPRYGTFNIHGSLLPKYRGAAPVQWAVINGERETGITVMRTDIGVDTGDIILQKKTDILQYETAGELMGRLSELGAQAICEAVDSLYRGTITYTPQDGSLATHSPMLRKVDGELDFSKSAAEVANKIHGLNPEPGAYTYLDDQLLKLHRVRIAESVSDNENFGTVVSSSTGTGIVVLCGKGSMAIETLQLAGGKALHCKDFLTGRKIAPGSILTPGL